LADPTEQEAEIFNNFKYQPNKVVLHTDASIMPKRRAIWSSWNYTEAEGKATDQIDLTYWMNSLQPWLKGEDIFVTLNSTRQIDPSKIYDEVTLHHPVYDEAALDAQRLAASINGENNTWFCGAWMKNGFHEDGLSSAYDVADAILSRATELTVAAE
jgi:predicted NAD/FAD-binding protein